MIEKDKMEISVEDDTKTVKIKRIIHWEDKPEVFMKNYQALKLNIEDNEKYISDKDKMVENKKKALNAMLNDLQKTMKKAEDKVEEIKKDLLNTDQWAEDEMSRIAKENVELREQLEVFESVYPKVALWAKLEEKENERRGIKPEPKLEGLKEREEPTVAKESLELSNVERVVDRELPLTKGGQE